MTVKDCILAAARYLDLPEIRDSITAGEYGGEDIAAFIDMTRDVVSEICADLFPLKISEFAMSDSEGNISLYAFSRPVIDVFAVLRGDGKNGESVPFSVKYDRIDTGFSGGYTVEYSFMPIVDNMDSELPFGERVGARVIGYGIAAEYALINSPEDAAVFDKRYKDALRKAVKPKGEKRVKRRVWA